MSKIFRGMSNNRKYSINVHCYSYILKGLFHKYLEVFCLFVFKHLFIFDRAGSSLLHGLFCSCDSQASHCSDICCCGQSCRVHRLKSRGGCLSNCGVCTLGHWLSILGSRAQLPVWDLPRAGTKPVSPELAGKLSTTREAPAYGGLV